METMQFSTVISSISFYLYSAIKIISEYMGQLELFRL